MNAVTHWLQHPVTLPAWLAYAGLFAAFLWVVGIVGMGVAIWLAKPISDEEE